MQPLTSKKFDAETFNRLKRSVGVVAKAKRILKNDTSYYSEIPFDIGFQINQQCNLRCKTCFLWNETGRNQYLDKKKAKDFLDVSIFEKILNETKSARSNLFFWGTEPLLHKDWDQYCNLIEKDPRWTVLCTNGILIEKQLDHLIKISANLAIVVSLDGLQEAHDDIRGKGTFEKTIKNIRLILDLQKKGKYLGKISIHGVLNKTFVPQMYNFMEFGESLGVDTVYFAFPWYISKQTCKEMDEFFYKNLSWLKKSDDNNSIDSWHSFAFGLDYACLEELKKQIYEINSRIWKIRIRFQPAVEIEEIEDFIKGGKKPAQNRTRCLALANRTDILADGSVTTCQPFPEFSVGNVNNQSLLEIWNSEDYNKIRKKIGNSLMPVCSKCILLYLNGC